MDLPPVLLNLLNSKYSDQVIKSNLSWIITGGEQLYYTHIDKLIDKVIIANGYGVTEAVVSSLWKIIKNKKDKIIPIGKPLPGVKLLICNEKMQICNVEELGELLIGGNALARGYLNNPNLTQEKFIYLNNDRYYRTGDLVKKEKNGEYIFLGRLDHQISMNGFRIEPFEIEAMIRSIFSVEQVVVTTHFKDNKALLICFYSAKDSLDNRIIYKELSKYLPYYKIPSLFYKIAQWPLTKNGKIDRKAMSEMTISTQGQLFFVKPKTQDEVYVANLLKNILNISKIGVHDNLIYLGLNSLMITQFLAQFNQRYKASLNIADFFENPTTYHCLNFYYYQKLQNHSAEYSIDKTDKTLLPVSASQKQLLFLDMYKNGQNVAYNICFGLELKGQLDFLVLEKSLNFLISKHDALRTHFLAVDGSYVQSIADNINFKLDLIVEDATNLNQALSDFANESFDIFSEKLIRFKVFQISSLHHVLAIVQHHAITDGWSIEIMKKDLMDIYNSLKIEGKYITPKNQIQYSEFSKYQQSYLNSNFIKNHFIFWKKYLHGSTKLYLPFKVSKANETSNSGKRLRFAIDNSQLEKIKNFCQLNNITPFMFFFVSFSFSPQYIYKSE